MSTSDSSMSGDTIVAGPRLTLLGGFQVHIGERVVTVPHAGQRVLALLAMRRGTERRSVVAGTLWDEKNERRAMANLRSAIWRLPLEIRCELDTTTTSLSLSSAWVVDLTEAESAVSRLREDPTTTVAVEPLRHDLLPDWDEPWLHFERERFRQLCVHALEMIAVGWLDRNEPTSAAEAALAATSIEPLRESAHGLLIRAELAQGNRAAALEHYRKFEERLRAECGVQPSGHLLSVMESLIDITDTTASPSSPGHAIATTR